MFGLTSLQNSIEMSQTPILAEDPQRLELNFSIPLEHKTELILLGERMFSIAIVKSGILKDYKEWTKVFPRKKTRRIFSLK